MVYITTTNWKQKFEEQDEKLSGLLCHFADLSYTHYPLDVMINQIDACEEKLYYSIVQADLNSILMDTDLSKEDKLEEVQRYLENLV